MTLLPMLASAETVMIDGIRYNLISKGNVAEVTSNSYNGDVSIPPSFLYDGVEYRVTSIGENAFANTSGLGSVTLPNTVSVIRSYAFRGRLGGIYQVSVYATKEGYEDSEVAMQEFTFGADGKIGDINVDGNVNAADIVRLVNIIMSPFYCSEKSYSLTADSFIIAL